MTYAQAFALALVMVAVIGYFWWDSRGNPVTVFFGTTSVILVTMFLGVWT